jgi:ureidoglycolate dehydrogenase (NAD+)
VKHYRAQGLPLEPGWAITAEDGHDVAALKPLGGHKGHCLNMMVEILCALLAGMPLDHELSHLYAEPYDEPRRVGHFFLAVDLAAFVDPEGFRRRLSALMACVRAEPAVAGERVLVPGDLESEQAAVRAREGIPLTAEELAFFAHLQQEQS